MDGRKKASTEKQLATRIKPGEIRNPLGGAAHSPIKKEFRKITEEQLREVMDLILRTHPEDLNVEIQKNPTILKTWIASAASTGIREGNLGNLLSILDRVLGKPKERLDIHHTTANMSEEKMREEIKRLEALDVEPS